MNNVYADYGYNEGQYDYEDDDEDYYGTDEDEGEEEVPVEYTITHADKVSHAELLKLQGNTLLKDDRVDDAITHYTAAVDLIASVIADGHTPEDVITLHSTLLSNRAAARIKAQRYSDALADAIECLKLTPDNSKARYREATCHCRLGDPAAARSSLLRLSAKDQADKSVAALVAEVEILEDEIRTARTLVSNATDEQWVAADSAVAALESRFSGSWVNVLRARVWLGQGKVPRAVKLLSALHLQAGHDAELALWRGVALYRNGQGELALRLLQDVLRGDPDNGEARRYLKLMRSLEAKKEEANALFKAGRAREALEAYSEALTLDPANTSYSATILSNRAAAHMQLGDHHAAARDCTDSLKLAADVAKVIARRGRCWAALGQYSDAVRDFTRASELDSSLDLDDEIRKAKVSEKRSKQTSLYTTLGVPVHASPEEVKKAYRRLAMQWHPDKHQGDGVKRAEEMFKRITEAYEVVGDADKRRKYDMGMDIDEINSDEGHSAGHRSGFGFARARRAPRGFGFF